MVISIVFPEPVFPDNRRVTRRFFVEFIPSALAVMQVQIIPAAAGGFEDGDGIAPGICRFVCEDENCAGSPGRQSFWLLTATRRGAAYTPRQLRQVRGGQRQRGQRCHDAEVGEGCASALVSFTTCSGLSEDTSRRSGISHRTCPDWSRSRRTIKPFPL